MGEKERLSDESIPVRSRIPRAPNLKSAKLILKKISNRDLISIDDYQSIGRCVLDSNYSMYLNDYLKLLIMLQSVKKVNKVIVIPDSTRVITREFTEREELTKCEVDFFKNRLLSNDSVRWFIESIFGYDIKKERWLSKSKSITSKAIANQYIALTGLSSSTGRREARLLTNWLGQIGLIEQSYNGKYYLTVGKLSFEMFVRVFEDKYRELEKAERSGTKWVEIPHIQASICEDYNISKKMFDSYFRRLVELRKGQISISPGSAGLKEVKRFGVEINSKLIYYMRVTGESLEP